MLASTGTCFEWVCLGLKDRVELVATVLGVCGALLAAGWALFEYRLNRHWKYADAAKGLLDDLWDDEDAQKAMELLDGERHVVFEALEWFVANRSGNERLFRVARYTDSFFGTMELLEHAIETQLVRPSDVRYPFGYYAWILAVRKDLVEAYLRKYRYRGARLFLERFDEWTGKNHPSSEAPDRSKKADAATT